MGDRSEGDRFGKEASELGSSITLPLAHSFFTHGEEFESVLCLSIAEERCCCVYHSGEGEGRMQRE